MAVQSPPLIRNLLLDPSGRINSAPHSGQGSFTDQPSSSLSPKEENLYFYPKSLFPPKISIFNPKSILKSLSCCKGKEAEEESEHLQVAQAGREHFCLYFSGFSLKLCNIFRTSGQALSVDGFAFQTLQGSSPALSSIAQPAPLLRDTFPCFSLDFSSAFHRKILWWPLLPFSFLIFPSDKFLENATKQKILGGG